jgi:hypothetical protein
MATPAPDASEHITVNMAGAPEKSRQSLLSQRRMTRQSSNAQHTQRLMSLDSILGNAKHDELQGNPTEKLQQIMTAAKEQVRILFTDVLDGSGLKSKQQQRKEPQHHHRSVLLLAHGSPEPLTLCCNVGNGHYKAFWVFHRYGQ